MKKEEVQLQGECPTHHLLQSFTCYTCKVFLCPTCLTPHIGHKNLVKSECCVHFLTHSDLHQYDNHEMILWVYDIPTKKLTTQYFKSSIFDQESILIQNIVYIVGGLTHMSSGVVEKAFNTVLAYNLKGAAQLETKASLTSGVCLNTLCTTNDQVIYSIGGKNRQGFTNACERYTISTNSWTVIKPLEEPKANVSLGVYDCIYIYAFGGRAATYLDSLETLDTRTDGNTWQVVKIDNNAKFFSPRNCMSVVQNPKTGLFMIFGGSDELGVSNDVFEFTLSTSKITLSDLVLSQSAVFFQRKPALYGDYYLLEYGRDIGIYTISEY